MHENGQKDLKTPQVSIGLVVYNGEKYIRQTLDALLGQTFRDFELLISDNSSSDRTPDICQEYCLKDPRVKYYRQESNVGVFRNLEYVLRWASADYFMWASHDDFWAPSFIQECLKRFEENKSAIMVSTMTDVIDPQTEKLAFCEPALNTVGLSTVERFKETHQLFYTPKRIGGAYYGIYRRHILLKSLPLPNIFAGDQVTLAELSLVGEFAGVEKPLFSKRKGGCSRSTPSVARALLLRNPFVARYVYLVREYNFQRVIFKSDKINALEKIGLSALSWFRYGLEKCKRIYWSIREPWRAFLNRKV